MLDSASMTGIMTQPLIDTHVILVYHFVILAAHLQSEAGRVQDQFMEKQI